MGAKGWGYCSTDPDQEDCNTEINNVMDNRLFLVQHLKQDYCMDQLMHNLHVEQPGEIV